MSDTSQGKRTVHFNDNARHLCVQVFGMQQIGKGGRGLHRADGVRAGRADADFENIKDADHNFPIIVCAGCVFQTALRPKEEFCAPLANASTRCPTVIKGSPASGEVYFSVSGFLRKGS